MQNLRRTNNQPAIFERDSEETATSPPVRVFVMDLLSIVPYYTGQLCASLAQVQGLEVRLGSITYGHDRSFFERMGLRNKPGLLDVVYRLPNLVAPVRQALKMLEYLLNLATLTVRFLLWQPDLIHVQFIPLVAYDLPFELWFLKLVRARGIKLIYTVHNILPQDTGDRHKAIYSRVYELIDFFVCHDAHAKGRLTREFAVSPHRISVIAHGPLFKPEWTTTPKQARVRASLPDDACVVLWHGIVRPYKGISFLLKAWKRALAAGANAVLVILGTGDRKMLSAIGDEVSSLGIASSVRLLFRFVSVDELATFFEAADVLIYPYSSEVTTSGALMTGIAYGKAIVASSQPAFEEILSHEDNALLVRYGDIEALATAIARLAGNAGLRAQLAARLRARHVNSPTWVDIARRTSECYRALLSSTPSLTESLNSYTI